MTVARISPPIPLDTPKGPAMAHFMTWDHELATEFGCFVNQTREFYWIKQQAVRLEENWTAATTKFEIEK